MAATYGRVDETYRIILFAVLFFVLLVLLVLRLWRLGAHSPVSVAWWTYTFPLFVEAAEFDEGGSAWER